MLRYTPVPCVQTSCVMRSFLLFFLVVRRCSWTGVHEADGVAVGSRHFLPGGGGANHQVIHPSFIHTFIHSVIYSSMHQSIHQFTHIHIFVDSLRWMMVAAAAVDPIKMFKSYQALRKGHRVLKTPFSSWFVLLLYCCTVY